MSMIQVAFGNVPMVVVVPVAMSTVISVEDALHAVAMPYITPGPPARPLKVAPDGGVVVPIKVAAAVAVSIA